MYIFLIILIFLSAFFSGTETAFFSLSSIELKKVLSKEYGRNMDGFVHDFCVTVGADGTVSGFAGTLCDMARVNSGDSDLGNELGVESAEEAAKSNA